ncbi:MAG: hypothetical protein LBD85_05530 [Oscillospiraceae bacterium]|jgi:hypothetical protein|nr:hypothetical protein [Oscillospiraceae bacterium]
MAMTMKIHKGNTSCGCVNGAGAGTPMICYPMYPPCGGWVGGGCGCDCADGGFGSHVLARAGAQIVCDTAPIAFNANTTEYGGYISHIPGGAEFVITQPGQYLVSWSVILTPGQGGTGSSYTFLVPDFPQTSATGIEGTLGYDGTVHNANILTLSAGDVITLTPSGVNPGTCVNINDAVMDITKIT